MSAGNKVTGNKISLKISIPLSSFDIKNIKFPIQNNCTQFSEAMDVTQSPAVPNSITANFNLTSFKISDIASIDLPDELMSPSPLTNHTSLALPSSIQTPPILEELHLPNSDFWSSTSFFKTSSEEYVQLINDLNITPSPISQTNYSDSSFSQIQTFTNLNEPSTSYNNPYGDSSIVYSFSIEPNTEPAKVPLPTLLPVSSSEPIPVPLSTVPVSVPLPTLLPVSVPLPTLLPVSSSDESPSYLSHTKCWRRRKQEDYLKLTKSSLKTMSHIPIFLFPQNIQEKFLSLEKEILSYFTTDERKEIVKSLVSVIICMYANT